RLRGEGLFSFWLRLTALILLYLSSLLGDLFHGSMFLAYFSEELLWRHIILDHAQSAEFGGNGRVLDRFFNSGNQRLCHLDRHSRRREEGQPDAKEVLAVAELRQGGDLGELRNLIRGEYSLHRSALQVAE